MVGKLVTGAGTLAAVIGVFISIGSIGTNLGWYTKDWKGVGVDPKVLHNEIAAFPNQHCDDKVRPLCEKMCNGVLWFLGL